MTLPTVTSAASCIESRPRVPTSEDPGAVVQCDNQSINPCIKTSPLPATSTGHFNIYLFTINLLTLIILYMLLQYLSTFSH